MKKSSFLSIVILILMSLLSQVPLNARGMQNFNDTTSKTLKGTFIKNGKVNLSPGFEVVFSDDKKIGTIRKQNGNGSGNGITGSYACMCKSEGSCKIGVSGRIVICHGDPCCAMYISPNSNNLAVTTKSGSEDANIVWKVLVIPKTGVTTTSN